MPGEAGGEAGSADSAGDDGTADDGGAAGDSGTADGVATDGGAADESATADDVAATDGGAADGGAGDGGAAGDGGTADDGAAADDGAPAGGGAAAGGGVEAVGDTAMEGGATAVEEPDAAAGDADGSARNEVLRRVVHASGTAFPAAYLAGVLTWPQLRVLLVAATVVAGALEVLRLVVGVDWRVYEAMTRGYEEDNPAGYALFAVGMAAVALAFEPTIAVPAMLMLTLGDPVSGLLAADELRDAKRSEAVLGMFGVCVGVAVLTGPGLVAALVGGLVATLADAVKPVVAGYVVDDNVTIPIGGALAMYAVVEATALLGGGGSVSLWLVASVAG